MRISIREAESPLLYRNLLPIESGSRRKVRIFSLLHLALGLELSGEAMRSHTDVTPEAPNADGDGDFRATRSEIYELFGETFAHSTEQPDKRSG